MGWHWSDLTLLDIIGNNNLLFAYKNWNGYIRTIHVLSLLAYLGITLHGFYAGTDSPLLSMQLLYKGTALVVIFLTVYWLVLKFQNKPTNKQNIPLIKSSIQQAKRTR